MSIAQVALDYDARIAEPAWSTRDGDPSVRAVSARDEIDYRTRLGKAIVQLRAMHGMSAAVLAERIDRSEAAISRWETGKATPTAWDLRRMADLFELPKEALDVLLYPPKGPVSPVAQRLAASAPGAARKGLRLVGRAPANGKDE